MARTTHDRIARAEADRFRADVIALLNIERPDWEDWEWRWLTDEARRQPDYLYSEKEQAVLERLIACAKSFGAYAGYTVPEMIAIACPHCADLTEEEQEFIEKLHATGATELKRRQLQRLAAICRRYQEIERDPLNDAAVQDAA
jgi:hypothetical protein